MGWWWRAWKDWRGEKLTAVFITSVWTWKEVITILIAMLGLGLGILNFVKSLNDSKVNVKVVTQHYFTDNLGGLYRSCAIEVINLSKFPITVASVGFQLRGGKWLPLTRPLDGGNVKRKLESRESTIYIFDPDIFNNFRHEIYHSIAKTACGETFVNKSKALKQMIREGIN